MLPQYRRPSSCRQSDGPERGKSTSERPGRRRPWGPWWRRSRNERRSRGRERKSLGYDKSRWVAKSAWPCGFTCSSSNRQTIPPFPAGSQGSAHQALQARGAEEERASSHRSPVSELLRPFPLVILLQTPRSLEMLLFWNFFLMLRTLVRTLSGCLKARVLFYSS